MSPCTIQEESHTKGRKQLINIRKSWWANQSWNAISRYLAELQDNERTSTREKGSLSTGQDPTISQYDEMRLDEQLESHGPASK